MLAQISITPVGAGVSVSEYVAKAVEVAEKSGLEYRVTAMGTILEGEWTDIMRVAREMHDRVLASSQRVLMNITIDDRKDKQGRIDSKVRAVEEKLGRPIRK